MPHRFAKQCAWIVFTYATLILAAWLLASPVMRSVDPAAVFMLRPMTALTLAIAALALAARASGWSVSFARSAAVVAVLLPLTLLAEILLDYDQGVELLFAPAGVEDKIALWRPAPQTVAGLLLLGIALLTGGARRPERFDAADAVTMLAVLLPFAVLLGYLLDASELYLGGGLSGGASPMAALLLLLLALGALSLHPDRGPLSAFTAATSGAAVGRRLVAWVIVLPVLFGCLQVWSVRVELLTLPLAVATTVTVSIMAFLYLIYRVSHLMTQLEAQQTEEHVQRESAAKEEGMTDALTSLLNRRGWEKHLRLEEERCKRHNHNGCIVMIDLDDLKKVNDTQGHSQGDELIKRAAQALTAGARRGDVLARLGGDEFAYLAIGCQPEHAGVVVRRLAESLMNAKVGASLGYALRDINVNLQGAFDEADRSMYANKRARKAKRAAEAAT